MSETPSYLDNCIVQEVSSCGRETDRDVYLTYALHSMERKYILFS